MRPGPGASKTVSGYHIMWQSSVICSKHAYMSRTLYMSSSHFFPHFPPIFPTFFPWFSTLSIGFFPKAFLLFLTFPHIFSNDIFLRTVFIQGSFSRPCGYSCYNHFSPVMYHNSRWFPCYSCYNFFSSDLLQTWKISLLLLLQFFSSVALLTISLLHLQKKFPATC